MVGSKERRRAGRSRPHGTTKGAATREAIVLASADLFNRVGVEQTTIADILEATGLEKGGLYNHFTSKDELAIAAFELAASTLEAEHLRAQRCAGPTAVAQLGAIVDVFVAMATRPLVRGGCPLLNTAMRSAHRSSPLRMRVRKSFARILGRIGAIVDRGIADGELRGDAIGIEVASFMVAALEGAVVLVTLYGEPTHMTLVAAMLRREIMGLRAGTTAEAV